jgi:6-phosphogluconolactonase (cycloisomerase 2 family)
MTRRTWVQWVMVITSALLPGTAVASAPRPAGVTYTMTNEAAGNRVAIFDRGPHGTLTWAGAVATGGRGTGAGLGNQGAVTLTADGRWLLVVNPGSHDLSVFAVRGRRLVLTDRASTRGATPISVSAHGGLVYVVNAGSDSIAGFRLGRTGRLHALSGSERGLSGSAVGPAQIQFSPNGRVLAVTEKATSLVTLFEVGRDGLPSLAQPYPSAGMTPFGFDFDRRGRLLVSEAAGGAPGASTVSSYRIGPGSRLQVITHALPTFQGAACWLKVDGVGRFAYVANTGSDSLTGLTVRASGELSLLHADGDTASTGPGPIDVALSADDRFVYVLNGGDASLSAFERRRDGSLRAIAGVATGVLPVGSSGLAAR